MSVAISICVQIYHRNDQKDLSNNSQKQTQSVERSANSTFHMLQEPKNDEKCKRLWQVTGSSVHGS